jgi:hypothetical protein
VAGGFIVFAIGKASFSQMQSILGATSHRLPLVLLCGERRCFLSAFQAVRFSDHRHRECRPVYHHGRKNLLGEKLPPVSTPLPADAYPFLVATFIGWIWMLWRSKKLEGA